MMRWVTAAVVASVLAACSTQARPPSDLADHLAGAVSADGAVTHLRKLQEIADANDHSRASGTPGYEATADYVAQTLSDNGFDVNTVEFEVLDRVEGGNPTLTVNGRDYQVDQASLLITTPPGGLNAVTLRPQRPAGCSARDYGSVSVRGAIAIVDDTACSVVDKQNAAVDRGAVGLLVVSPPRATGGPAGLFPAGYYHQLTIPVGVIDSGANTALRRTTAEVRLVLDSRPVMKKARNILAQTKSGSTDNVVMVGAHLDSGPRSPGINDDGSGIAAVLEIAAALGAQPNVNNAVRVAFWGSEENGLRGSTQYLRGLEHDELAAIALYLDLEMLGSPNAGYFTYDGDQSGQLNPAIAVADVPEGSAGIERTLAGYLNTAGVRPADMPLSTRADHSVFLTAGVPVGGLTTGSSQRKTEVQQRLWGGRANQPFDPNYRTPRDTVDHLDREALSVMMRAAAFAVGTYAQSVDGVNGVPSHEERIRNAP